MVRYWRQVTRGIEGVTKTQVSGKLVKYACLTVIAKMWREIKGSYILTNIWLPQIVVKGLEQSNEFHKGMCQQNLLQSATFSDVNKLWREIISSYLLRNASLPHLVFRGLELSNVFHKCINDIQLSQKWTFMWYYVVVKRNKGFLFTDKCMIATNDAKRHEWHKVFN